VTGDRVDRHVSQHGAGGLNWRLGFGRLSPSLSLLSIVGSTIDFPIHLISGRTSFKDREGLTRKFPSILLGLQTMLSVHLLIPLSCSSNKNTAPECIMGFSGSLSRRVMRGIAPLLAASNIRRASYVVSMKPMKGGAI